MRTWLWKGAAIIGVAGIGLWAAAPLLERTRPELDDDVPPTSCLQDAQVQFSAAPSAIVLGQTSKLSWAVSLPAGCTVVKVSLQSEAVWRSGSRNVAPAGTATYHLTVRNRAGVAGSLTRSVKVTVTYPPVVVIDGRTASPATVLVNALGSFNDKQTVELCDVDLDLTGYAPIYIQDHRTVTASPGCERGPRKLGPRIFVRRANSNAPLFELIGDDIVFSGFRLEGPVSLIAQGDNTKVGIRITPYKEKTAPIEKIEISNMEIYYWSGAGLSVRDNPTAGNVRGRLFNTRPNAVHITGNYLHHNRHIALGYGVSVGEGAFALIERNVFDENRHAIGGGSKHEDFMDYSGYIARENLFLTGGGKHCNDNFFWALTGWTNLRCTQTHQIDMHGDGNVFPTSNNWLCGTAGETTIIERNTVLYTSGAAIKIRGNPADKAVVDGNVFKHSKRSDAIKQNGACGWGGNITNPIDVRPNNQFGVDPMAQLGSCDFAGDGVQDQFMATGVTWWAKSPITNQWRYLNTMTERLPALVLRRIDADLVCDVGKRTEHAETATLNQYSQGGTTPWKSLQVLEQ